MHGRRWLLMATMSGIALLSGCGGADDWDGPTVDLRVTRDFGHELLVSDDRAPLEGRRNTMLRMLREDHRIRLSEFGITIEAIDGRRRTPGPPDDRETIWAANVNGIETDVQPPEYALFDGDVVQLDLRHWYVTLDVRATVGAFPETFRRGVFGRRFPVRVRCERESSWACGHVKRLLGEAGVPIDGAKPPGPLPKLGNPRRAEVLVGTWKHWRNAEWPHRIDRGARYSGVFARFAPDAESLRLLDWNAHRVRSVGAGTGLVAAQRPTEEDLQWAITGVDDEGVERAARALSSPDLRDAFAAAVTDEGVVKLPLPPPSSR